jgi:multidrug efflux pump subunit AcrA (membrane-fusion protein)
MAAVPERKDVPPFLEVDPPHWAARGLSYILIALFVTAVLIAILVRIPETVSCPFVLQPTKGTDPIRALYDATVLQVRALEGQIVKQGDPIFIMRADSVVDRASEYKSLESRKNGAMESLNNVRRKYESEKRSDEQDIQALQNRNETLSRMIALRTEELALLKQKVDSYKKLYDTGIASQTAYADQELEVKRGAVQLEELQRELSDNKAAIEKLQTGMITRRVEFQESEHSWNQEIERTTTRMGMLKSGLNQPSGGDLVVKASCNGTILRLRITAPGAVVQDGDVLGELVCADEQLQAELNVPQNGVGRITTGQEVKLLYDSFPFQRFGVKSGIVRWISPAAVSNKGQSAFRVLVDPAERMISVEGQQRPLLPGMGGLAQIVVGRRSLISYAFEPIRQLRENMK